MIPRRALRRLAPVVVCALALPACSSASAIQSRRAEPIDVGTSSPAPAGTDAPGGSGSEGPPERAPAGGDPAADGIGDALFPELGNPGLDVTHYDVELSYDPADDVVAGTVTMSITPTAARSTFTLDAIGLDVDGVTVGGRSAEFAVEPVELRVTPAEPLATGVPVEVTITWSCDPSDRQSAAGLPNGWFDTPQGSYVLDEPDGMRTWMPSNDHPSDKATWRFAITVPEGLTGVANGRLVDDQPNGTGGHTWTWEETAPMATYLVQLVTGPYEVVHSPPAGDVELTSVVLADDRDALQPHLDGIAAQIEFYERYFGPYPFERYGLAVVDSPPGLAMEDQERSQFSRLDLLGGRAGDTTAELLLSHELAHQWFGDAVTPDAWQDIWLNESFATYAQWMWFEQRGIDTVDQLAGRALRQRPPGATATPDVEEMFGVGSYEGGAVVLHALRRTIGDDDFFELLRRWVGDNAGTSRSTADFVELAGAVSGRDLGPFFAAWLYAERTPDAFPAPA